MATHRAARRWARRASLAGVLAASVLMVPALPSEGTNVVPARRAGSLDVFPVRGPCHYKDTFGARRGQHRRHEGVDIIAPRGRPIYAVRDGRISKKYYNAPRAGYAIQITLPDGTYFFYAHLSRYARGMKVGVRVHAGQVIGYVGKTGNAGIYHLHFEIHPHGGRAVDPTGYVRRVDGCGSSTPATTTTERTTTTQRPTTTERTTTTDDSSSSGSPGASALRLLADDFDGGLTTHITVTTDGAERAVRAELTIAASHGRSRGSVLVSDCTNPSKAALAIIPGRTTTSTGVRAVGRDGKVCVTTTVDARVEISLRRVWTRDGSRVTVSRRITAFDSSSSGRYPSPSDVFKVRLDQSLGVPAGAQFLLVRMTARSSHDATVTAGPCGAKRQQVAEVGAGSSVRKLALVRVNGADLCLGATERSAVHVDILGYG